MLRVTFNWQVLRSAAFNCTAVVFLSFIFPTQVVTQEPPLETISLDEYVVDNDTHQTEASPEEPYPADIPVDNETPLDDSTLYCFSDDLFCPDVPETGYSDECYDYADELDQFVYEFAFSPYPILSNEAESNEPAPLQPENMQCPLEDLHESDEDLPGFDLFYDECAAGQFDTSDEQCPLPESTFEDEAFLVYGDGDGDGTQFVAAANPRRGFLVEIWIGSEELANAAGAAGGNSMSSEQLASSTKGQLDEMFATIRDFDLALNVRVYLNRSMLLGVAKKKAKEMVPCMVPAKRPRRRARQIRIGRRIIDGTSRLPRKNGKAAQALSDGVDQAKAKAQQLVNTYIAQQGMGNHIQVNFVWNPNCVQKGVIRFTANRGLIETQTYYLSELQQGMDDLRNKIQGATPQ